MDNGPRLHPAADRMTTRPAAVGYLCPADEGTRRRWHQAMGRWAEAEGLTFLDVYADPSPGVPIEQRSWLAAAVARATREDAQLLVPDADDLPGEEHWTEIQALLESAQLKIVVLPDGFLR